MPNTLVEVTVGSLVSATAEFLLPTTVNTVGAIVQYELQDANGVVYYSGTANSLVENALSASKKILTATANFSIPPQVPVTTQKEKYRLLWQAYTAQQVPVASYTEAFSISPATRDPFGVPDIVECLIDTAVLTSVLPCDGLANVQVYKGNTCLTAAINLAATGVPAYQGNRYRYEVIGANALGIRESVEPYSVLWQYNDNVTGELITEDGYLYHINPSILMAAKELQSLVNRAHNSARLPETQMDLNVCIHFLKMGMDLFNGIGFPTYFDMTNATGAVRTWWLACSEVLLLQSQYLLEAERSFTMAGQSVQLDFDITQFYDSAAQTKQSAIDANVPDLKRNLTRKGQISGSGNITSALSRNTGAVGITLSPVSNYWSARYPRFRM